MLAVFRQSRVLALVLVLLAPGISGSAVQWLHACPVESAEAAEHGHHGPGPDSGPASSCECIGACNTTAPLSPPTPVAFTIQAGEPRQGSLPLSATSFIAAGTPSDLLPPATAPPLA